MSAYLVLGGFGLYDWRKYKQRYDLWFTWFGAVGFIIELVYYVLIVAGSSAESLTVIDAIAKVFDVVLLMAIILLVISTIQGSPPILCEEADCQKSQTFLSWPPDTSSRPRRQFLSQLLTLERYAYQ